MINKVFGILENTLFIGETLPKLFKLLLTLVYYDNIVMEHREGKSNPDPLDRSILVLQDKHRSQLVDSNRVYMYI